MEPENPQNPQNPSKLESNINLFEALEFILLIGNNKPILRGRDNSEQIYQTLNYLKDRSYIGLIHDIYGPSAKEAYYSSSLTKKGKEVFEKASQFVQSVFKNKP